ncbi:unnamed protein product, partial [Mycena citricolor]
ERRTCGRRPGTNQRPRLSEQNMATTHLQISSSRSDGLDALNSGLRCDTMSRGTRSPRLDGHAPQWSLHCK